jgi:hypothetical protein
VPWWLMLSTCPDSVVGSCRRRWLAGACGAAVGSGGPAGPRPYGTRR